jgi:hypothetical protein
MSFWFFCSNDERFAKRYLIKAIKKGRLRVVKRLLKKDSWAWIDPGYSRRVHDFSISCESLDIKADYDDDDEIVDYLRCFVSDLKEPQVIMEKQ